MWARNLTAQWALTGSFWKERGIDPGASAVCADTPTVNYELSRERSFREWVSTYEPLFVKLDGWKSSFWRADIFIMLVWSFCSCVRSENCCHRRPLASPFGFDSQQKQPARTFYQMRSKIKDTQSRRLNRLDGYELVYRHGLVCRTTLRYKF